MNDREPDQDWTAERLLWAWGCWQNGGRLKSVGPKLTRGGDAGTDDEMQAYRYVEATGGYSVAHPVLTWVYAEYRTLESFQIREPGETLIKALLRRGWGMFLGDRGLRHIHERIMDEFTAELIDKTRREPFRPIRESEEEMNGFQIDAASKSLRNRVA